MITALRAPDPRAAHDRLRAEPFTPAAGGFGVLDMVVDDRLAPHGTLARQPGYDAEVVTYVREGAVAYGDSTGQSGVVRAGEFHRMSAGSRVHSTGTNPSSVETAHVIQIWLRSPRADLRTRGEHRLFSVAERRGALCLVASPDGRRGSLRVFGDVLVYSAVLDRGQHVASALAPGRHAWLHVVQGEATVGDVVLTTADSAGFTAERAVSLTAREQTEILLLLVDAAPPRWGQEVGGA